MQIFAPCGLAAAQMTLGLVLLYDGLHLGPKARVLAAQAVLERLLAKETNGTKEKT